MGCKQTLIKVITIFIYAIYLNISNNMTLEELYKESKEHEESEAKEDKEEDSDANKAYDSALLETLTSLTAEYARASSSADLIDFLYIIVAPSSSQLPCQVLFSSSL